MRTTVITDYSFKNIFELALQEKIKTERSKEKPLEITIAHIELWVYLNLVQRIYDSLGR